MKTPIKILIVIALAAAAIAAVVLKQNKGKTPADTAAASAAVTWEKPPVTRYAPTGSAAATVQLPRLVDLGADKCIPCKMMAPVLEELRKEYAGKMEVEFIDVWKNPDAGKPYGIEVIPTQILYDATGKELCRHIGFVSKADVLAKWRELGVELTVKPSPRTSQ